MALFSKSHLTVNTLEADGIWLEYGQRKILQNIYLRVDVGTIVGLLGRNGSGKSSLLDIIYGIKAAQNSSVRINGRYVGKLYRHRHLLAYLPQKSFIPDQLRVSEAFSLFESNRIEARAYFPELDELLPYRFKQLSGGQKRLAETILIMSSPAPLLCLDEPFSNVMTLHIETLKRWLTALKSRKGILLTDHYYQDVLSISDNVYLLNMGGRTILLQQPLQQLKDLGYIH